MNRYLFFFCLLSLCCACGNSTETPAEDTDSQAKQTVEPPFTQVVRQLVNAEIESFDIAALGRARVKYPFKDSLDADANDRLRNHSGAAKLRDYEPLRKEDILKIDEAYVLTLLRRKGDTERRALTLTPGGSPIETILLYTTFGNNEYKVSRSYTDDAPYKYDEAANQFSFTDRRTDTEWIEFPTKGEEKITYELERIVSLSENGRFLQKK